MMPKTGTLHRLAQLSSPELGLIERWLQRRRAATLTRLCSDTILCILDMLPMQDKISLIRALHENVDVARTTERLRHQSALCNVLLVEMAMRHIIRCIHEVSDNILYCVPGCFTEYFNYIFCDWTPFTSKRVLSCAMVYWDAAPPHARVVVNELTLRRFVTYALWAGKCTVRLTAHTSVDSQMYDVFNVMRTRVDGKIVGLAIVPLNIRTVHMLADTEWVALSKLRMRE